MRRAQSFTWCGISQYRFTEPPVKLGTTVLLSNVSFIFSSWGLGYSAFYFIRAREARFQKVSFRRLIMRASARLSPGLRRVYQAGLVAAPHISISML